MHTREWDPDLFRATLAEISKRADLDEPAIAELAGMSRSQVNRWFRAENRPRYDGIARFTSALTSRFPRTVDLARKLHTAAGYGPPGDAPPAIAVPAMSAPARPDAIAHSPPSAPRDLRDLADLLELWKQDRESLIRNHEVLMDAVRALERDRDQMRGEIATLRATVARLLEHGQAETA